MVLRQGLEHELRGKNMHALGARRLQRARETVPYEFFKKKTWMYEHEKHVKALKDLVSHTELA